MGYDVYLSFTASVPDAATSERLREAFFTPDLFGPTLYVESGDDYLYGTWEGRNCSKEDTIAFLRPLANQFGVTFDVTYSSDYDDGSQRFFVGTDANSCQAAYDLEKLSGLLTTLNSKPDVLKKVLEQNSAKQKQLIPLVETLQQILRS
ncbi:MAG: hypothetical protein H6670_11055 [Anaerolineaceae bacterium]|nr:hypothetical protein [Anaerolineaceae bacterium]